MECSKLEMIEKASIFQDAIKQINPELAANITLSDLVQFLNEFKNWEAKTVIRINSEQLQKERHEAKLRRHYERKLNKQR